MNVNLILDIVCLVVLAGVALRMKGFRGALVGVAAGALLACGTIAVGYAIFGAMRAMCWALFVGIPVILLRDRTWPAGLVAAALVVVGIDAFFIEPHALQVNHHTLTSDKIDKPLRIVLVADLQTDQVGAYEEDAMTQVVALAPDLVLFAGDTVQAPVDVTWREHRAANQMLRRVGIPSLPSVAVEGDTDRTGWATVYDGISNVSAETTRYELADIVVWGLSVEDSRADELPDIVEEDAFTVVLGHSPDFALAEPEADLLLAGHVHGGQVQLPFYGPLMTLSELPRDWTHGRTELPWGGDLFVSRGVGMERRDAPRLRFLCRPELVVIDVRPTEAPEPEPGTPEPAATP